MDYVSNNYELMKLLKLLRLSVFSLFVSVSCSEYSPDADSGSDDAFYEAYDTVSDDIIRFIENNEDVTYDSVIDYVSGFPEVESVEKEDDILYIHFAGGYTFFCDINGMTTLGDEVWSFDEDELEHLLDSLAEESSLGDYVSGAEPVDDEMLSEIENGVIENEDVASESITKAGAGNNLTLLSRRTALIWSPFPEIRQEKLSITRLMKRCGIKEVREPKSYAPASMSLFKDYDFVVILAHGMPDGCLSVSYGYKSLYEEELKAGTVMKGTKGLVLTRKFLEKYLPEMPRTIIWTIVCYSGRENSVFLEIAKKKDVADFFGGDNTLTSPLPCSPLKDYIPKFFIGGQTSEKSFMDGKSYYSGGSMKGMTYIPCKYWRRGVKDVCYVSPETGAPGTVGSDFCVVNLGISYPSDIQGAALPDAGIQLGVCLLEEETGRRWYIPVSMSGQYTTFYSKLKSIQSRAVSLRNLSPGIWYRYVTYLRIDGNYIFASSFRRFRTVPAEESAESKVRDYLVKFYQDTNGDNWIDNTNWCSDKPVDEWYGVSFDGTSLDISLPNNRLIGTVDLSGCTWLRMLVCERSMSPDISVNRIESVNVSGCTSLVYLDVDEHKEAMRSLDISGCSSLRSLYCSNTGLDMLDVSDCPDLRILYCRDNNLKSLDISRNRNLEVLSFSGNPIAQMDVSCLPMLEIYECSHTGISEVDVSSNRNLQRLYCDGAPVRSLDLSGLGRLEIVECDDCCLEELVLDGCVSIKELVCYNHDGGSNRLKNIDLSDLVSLRSLKCYSIGLERLDLSGLEFLEDVQCYGNDITEINIHGCTSLIDLDCSDNLLTDIDLDDFRTLRWFNCSGNMISREIPEWMDGLEKFGYDERYRYRNGRYEDMGYGWWYPGEPEKGYHGRD